MSFDTVLYVRDTQGSMVAVTGNPTGVLPVVPTGDAPHDAVDAGNPVKIGGVARTTNPTAVANGDRVDAFYDTVGRQVSWLYQVRNLTTTASTVLATGTSGIFATAGGAGVFRDLVSISMANDSSVAATVTLLDDSLAVRTFRVPANDTINFNYHYPLLQGTANGEWQIDMEDITGTNVTVEALFINNV